MKTPRIASPATLAAGLVPTQGREGIGQRVNPLHAMLHAQNSAKLAAMEAAERTPVAPTVPGIKPPKVSPGAMLKAC